MYMCNVTCVAGTMLHVWLVQCYMCGWYNVTCVAGAMLHVWLVQCYMCSWYNVTCVAGAMLHVLLVQCYMCSWYSYNGLWECRQSGLQGIRGWNVFREVQGP